MQTRYAVALSILVGGAIGGGAVQTLHAQIKPPVYLIAQERSNEPRGLSKRVFHTNSGLW